MDVQLKNYIKETFKYERKTNKNSMKKQKLNNIFFCYEIKNKNINKLIKK